MRSSVPSYYQTVGKIRHQPVRHLPQQKSTPDGSGSNTNGLQNYDDLYADVARWVKEGWIDYNIPQIYWEIGHPAADYITLINGGTKTRHGKARICISAKT